MVAAICRQKQRTDTYENPASIIIDHYERIRHHLQNPRDISIRLFEDGRITVSQFEQITNQENVRQTQIDTLLRYIIKQNCCDVFLDIIKEIEPRLAKWIICQTKLDQYAPTIKTKGRRGKCLYRYVTCMIKLMLIFDDLIYIHYFVAICEKPVKVPLFNNIHKF